MKIGPKGLENLADMICGDHPFNDFFPYRSSYYLTRFFINLDLDYVHDGSTRRNWVNGVLRELNAKQPISDSMPSKEIVKVIENLLHPDNFLFNEKVDHEKSKNSVKTCLKTYDLTIAEQSNGLIKIPDYQEASASVE